MQDEFSQLQLIFCGMLGLSKVYVMGEGGLEPPTSSLSGMRSNQLSYTPIGLFCKN